MNKAVARSRAASGRTKYSGTSGRFNARGRGSKIVGGLKRSYGWHSEMGMRFRTRRIIVKARVVKLKGAGSKAAYAHLRYLQCEGTSLERSTAEAIAERDARPDEFDLQRDRNNETDHDFSHEFEPQHERSNIYTSFTDEADGLAFLKRGQGDRHQFLFIVSPEDGAELGDLRPFARDLMRDMERDLNTRLDWVAVGHYDTSHPHIHILVWGVTAGANRKLWILSDERGSMVSYADADGEVAKINRYTAFGEQPGGSEATNEGTYRYTGQTWLPEVGLYYYKARYYHADIGRFLQTNPIGYEADLNLYAYAFNDPVNLTDPNGEMPFPQSFGVSIGCGLSGGGGCGEQIQRANLSEGAGVLLGSTPLLAAGATSAAVPVFLSRAPEITAATEVAAGFVPGTEGVAFASGAAFAQKTFGETFSFRGQQIFQNTLGVAVKTIDDLAEAIRGGNVNASDVPIQTIIRNGNELILNTRSAQALERAGVDRSQFNTINMTGDAAAEARLTGQLERNGLTSAGCATPVSTGLGC